MTKVKKQIQESGVICYDVIGDFVTADVVIYNKHQVSIDIHSHTGNPAVEPQAWIDVASTVINLLQAEIGSM